MLKSILGLSPVAAGLFAACLLSACGGDGATPCAEGEDCKGTGSLDGADAGKAPSKNKDASVKDARVATSDATVLASKKYLPCDVAPIVADKCNLCHGVSPDFGAPMSLVTAADFQATAEDKRAMYANVKDKISETTPSLQMPPVSSDQLSDDEKSTLLAWLGKGAPGAEKACVDEPRAPDAGASDAGYAYTEPTDDDLTCYKLTASNGDLKTPFQVGVAQDAYYAFTFAAPWPDPSYGIVVRAVIDNKKALHHWLLFQDLTPGLPTGGVKEIGAHPAGQLIAVWTPGADPMDFRQLGQGVGLELPGGSSTYTLELHYNSSDASAVDASGVEICVDKHKPANIAAYSWLGYDNNGFPSTEWTGTCSPFGQTDPIHIVSLNPHMHLTGIHMKGTINRKDGTKEVIHDAPFDFNNQKSYPVDLTLMPGDTITTVCDYNTPQTFGQATTKEMCYLFSMAYPKGKLASPDIWGTVAHGASSCLGQ